MLAERGDEAARFPGFSVRWDLEIEHEERDGDDHHAIAEGFDPPSLREAGPDVSWLELGGGRGGSQ